MSWLEVLTSGERDQAAARVGLHRAAGDPEGLGDLGLGLVEVVAEHDDLALPTGQRADRLPHPVGVLVDDGALLGRGEGVRRLLQALRDGGQGATATETLAPTVDHALVQVGDGRRRVPEQSPAAVEREEGVLHDLLGGLAVIDEDRRESDEAAVVCQEQLGDGRGSAGLRPHAELGHGAHLFPPDDFQTAKNVHTG